MLADLFHAPGETTGACTQDAIGQSGGTRLSSGFVEAESLSDLTSLMVAAAGV